MCTSSSAARNSNARFAELVSVLRIPIAISGCTLKISPALVKWKATDRVKYWTGTMDRRPLGSSIDAGRIAMTERAGDAALRMVLYSLPVFSYLSAALLDSSSGA